MDGHGVVLCPIRSIIDKFMDGRADLMVIVLQGLVLVIAVSLLMLTRKSEREAWVI